MVRLTMTSGFRVEGARMTAVRAYWLPTRSHGGAPLPVGFSGLTAVDAGSFARAGGDAAWLKPLRRTLARAGSSYDGNLPDPRAIQSAESVLRTCDERLAAAQAALAAREREMAGLRAHIKNIRRSPRPAKQTRLSAEMSFWLELMHREGLTRDQKQVILDYIETTADWNEDRNWNHPYFRGGDDDRNAREEGILEMIDTCVDRNNRLEARGLLVERDNRMEEDRSGEIAAYRRRLKAIAEDRSIETEIATALRQREACEARLEGIRSLPDEPYGWWDSDLTVAEGAVFALLVDETDAPTTALILRARAAAPVWRTTLDGRNVLSGAFDPVDADALPLSSEARALVAGLGRAERLVLDRRRDACLPAPVWSERTWLTDTTRLAGGISLDLNPDERLPAPGDGSRLVLDPSP